MYVATPILVLGVVLIILLLASSFRLYRRLVCMHYCWTRMSDFAHAQAEEIDRLRDDSDFPQEALREWHSHLRRHQAFIRMRGNMPTMSSDDMRRYELALLDAQVKSGRGTDILT